MGPTATTAIERKLTFEVIIDEAFSTITTDLKLSPVNNKKVFSLINDFEDGNWRYKKFQNFIWDNIKETALSARERDALINEGESSILSHSVEKLRFTDKDGDIGKGSELAEILLYGVMKHYYKALPVIPKIFYKQNSSDPAKGADSVHIVVEGENDFTIWFGEAKFYNSIEDARLDSIVQSVENSLQTDKLKKENSIITNIKDLEYLVVNESLRNKIIKSLSERESIDDLKSRIHIPILLLHECDITKAENALTDDYKNKIRAFHKQRAEAYFKKQIKKISSKVFKYSEIKFHIILFPVPDKKLIIENFTSKADALRK